MKKAAPYLFFIVLMHHCFFSFAQKISTDAATPLHALPPAYPVPYLVPATDSITVVLKKIYNYLNNVTPPLFIDRVSGKPVTDLARIDTNTTWQNADFRLTSYEWGVTYSGMLLAGEAIGDSSFTGYANERLQFIANAAPAFKKLYAAYPKVANPLRQAIDPKALDDAGAICAAMIKAMRKGDMNNLRPVINQYIDYITTKEYRLQDGTLARNRPQKNTLWLDDLYMSVPALAQMGSFTGDKKYFDDAIKQVLQFSQRMFNKEKNVYMHGWVQQMQYHPQFHWARANGWALMAMVELLDVLPPHYKGRAEVLAQLQAHIKGITSYQSGQGFWHQLLDRPDSYLETSATAIFTFCIARAINKSWVDALAFGPACILGWNALTTKVTDKGQVEGTCVGTGMAFDPAFYYYRPVSLYAAHGYGPMLLAGAEMILLLKNHNFKIDDSALQLKQ